MNIKWDGHTHSQYCPHAKIEKTEHIIQKAIDYKFTHISVTEHFPLPPSLLSKEYTPKDMSIDSTEIVPYIQHLTELKKKYASQITLLIGMEVDYLPKYEEFTQQHMDKYASYLDDFLFSLHFLPVNEELFMFDFQVEYLKHYIIDTYGTIEKVHEVYWENILKMINSQLNLPFIQRISHLGLIYKYNKIYPIDKKIQEEHFSFIKKYIFPVLQKKKYFLDFNVSGFRKPYFGENYILEAFQEFIVEFSIPTVFGSDTHQISDFGQYYSVYENFCAQEKKPYYQTYNIAEISSYLNSRKND